MHNFPIFLSPYQNACIVLRQLATLVMSQCHDFEVTENGCHGFEARENLCDVTWVETSEKVCYTF